MASRNKNAQQLEKHIRADIAQSTASKNAAVDAGGKDSNENINQDSGICESNKPFYVPHDYKYSSHENSGIFDNLKWTVFVVGYIISIILGLILTCLSLLNSNALYPIINNNGIFIMGAVSNRGLNLWIGVTLILFTSWKFGMKAIKRHDLSKYHYKSKPHITINNNNNNGIRRPYSPSDWQALKYGLKTEICKSCCVLLCFFISYITLLMAWLDGDQHGDDQYSENQSIFNNLIDKWDDIHDTIFDNDVLLFFSKIYLFVYLLWQIKYAIKVLIRRILTKMYLAKFRHSVEELLKMENYLRIILSKDDIFYPDLHTFLIKIPLCPVSMDGHPEINIIERAHMHQLCLRNFSIDVKHYYKDLKNTNTLVKQLQNIENDIINHESLCHVKAESEIAEQQQQDEQEQQDGQEDTHLNVDYGSLTVTPSPSGQEEEEETGAASVNGSKSNYWLEVDVQQEKPQRLVSRSRSIAENSKFRLIAGFRHNSIFKSHDDVGGEKYYQHITLWSQEKDLSLRTMKTYLPSIKNASKMLSLIIIHTIRTKLIHLEQKNKKLEKKHHKSKDDEKIDEIKDEAKDETKNNNGVGSSNSGDYFLKSQFVKVFTSNDKENKKYVNDEVGGKAFAKFNIFTHDDKLYFDEIETQLQHFLLMTATKRTQLESFKNILRTVHRVGLAFGSFVILFIGLILFESSFVDALSIYVSILAVSVIFGRDVLSRVMNGIVFIFFVKPFHIGDAILINGQRFNVKKITLFRTTMMDSFGNMYQWTNDELLKKMKGLVNLSITTENKHDICFYVNANDLLKLKNTHLVQGRNITFLQLFEEKVRLEMASECDGNSIQMVIGDFDRLSATVKVELWVSSYSSFVDAKARFDAQNKLYFLIAEALGQCQIDFSTSIVRM